MIGVHNYLRDLLTDAPKSGWQRPGGRVKPEYLRDVCVMRPKIRMMGWSGAPQVSGRGRVHIAHGIAYGTYKGERVGFVVWVCGGCTTFPVLGEPQASQEWCERCKELVA